MKRKRVAVLSFFIAVSLLFGGCASDTSSTDSVSGNQQNTETEFDGNGSSGEGDEGTSGDGDLGTKQDSGGESGTEDADTLQFQISSGTAFSKLAEEQEETDSSLTILVYMMGSDLESGAAAATNDMQEMMDNEPDLTDTHVLVYTGGSKAWHNGVPTDANMIYELVEEGFYPAAEYEPVSMGEASTLTEFLDYAVEHTDSDRYALILWDHGNGPLEGYGKDTQFENDALRLTEIMEALKASPFGEDNKLSFVGFDACLMSSAELAVSLADYADYLIASQEVEPSYGWNYAFLANASKRSTEGLIRDIIDTYVDYNEFYFTEHAYQRTEVTLAAMDLSYAGILEDKLNALFSEAGKDMSGDYFSLAAERVSTRAFGRASTGSEYDLVDLTDLMTSMEGDYEEQAKEVKEILEKFIVCNGTNASLSSGVSLYYPFYNKKYYTSSWGEIYQELDVLHSYASYLDSYSKIWLSTDMQDYFTESLEAQTTEKGGNISYTLQLTEEQAERYAKSGYYILSRDYDSGNLYRMAYYSSNVTYEDGLITSNFDGNVIYCTNDYGEQFIPVMREWDTVDGVTSYTAFPVFTETYNKQFENFEENSVSSKMQFSLDQETKELTITGITKSEDEEELSSGKAEEIDLSEFAHAKFYLARSRYLTRDDDGRIMDYWDWPEDSWIRGMEIALADGMEFVYEPLYDDGKEYYIMFRVTDLQENVYCSEPLPISLADAPENENTEDIEEYWESGSSFIFYEENGVTLKLIYGMDNGSYSSNGAEWYMEVQNENTFPINVQIKSKEINGIYRDSDSTYLNVDAGETRLDTLSGITSICAAAELALPEELELVLEITNRETDGHLVYKIPYLLHISESITPTAVSGTILDAAADAQVLYENDDVRFTLQEFGADFSVSDFSASLDIKTENLSEELQNVSMQGFSVNGYYFEANHSLAIEPGMYGYLSETDIGTQLRRSILTKEGEEISLIDSIERLILYLQYGEEEIACEVKLSEYGEATDRRIEIYPALYEDDNVSIREGIVGEDDWYNGNSRYIWLENKTNVTLLFTLSELTEDGTVIVSGPDDENGAYEIYSASCSLPAETATYVRIPASGEEITLRYQWQKAGNEEIMGSTPRLSLS